METVYFLKKKKKKPHAKDMKYIIVYYKCYFGKRACYIMMMCTSGEQSSSVECEEFFIIYVVQIYHYLHYQLLIVSHLFSHNVPHRLKMLTNETLLHQLFF